MNDTTSQLIIDGQQIIIYNNRKPDTYPESEIFDPENPESGKVFPSLYSIIIKTDGSLWYVSARDESTFKSTLSPCKWVSVGGEETVRIVSYGNDKFCLYQDNRTSPTKLVVDAKLLFAGNNLVEYSLYRTTEDGREELISMYFDAADKFISNRIPMQSISETHVSYKFPTNCHTTHVLTEGEPIILRVFNNLGNIAAEITIFVRDAIWLNDLVSHTNPIAKLDATCLQMKGEDFYIFEKQDPSHLNIQPKLVYVDGSVVDIPVDEIQTFLYGLDDLVPSYPGYSQKIVLKYFLSARETSLEPCTVNGKRFLTCTKNVVVVNNLNDYSAKVSTFPVYSEELKAWKLRFFAYGSWRNAVYDITDQVVFEEGYEFDGTPAKWGHEQTVKIEYDLQPMFNSDNPMPGAQQVLITVWDPTSYARYTMRDNESDTVVYGADGSIVRRPVIWYDSVIEQYFIPTSIFHNQEAVLESFFTLARPPRDMINEAETPVPNYFTIRDVYSGTQIVGGNIPIENWGAAWNTIVGTPVLAGSTVIVEFLEHVGTTYNLLYGVPVDVKEGTYNTEDATLPWEG